MKSQLSNQMEKCLDFIKEESVSLYDEMIPGTTRKITRGATKHKKFTAIVYRLSVPMFHLFINDKAYGFYFFKNNKWIFEQD